MSATPGPPPSRRGRTLVLLAVLPVVGTAVTLGVQLHLATWGGVTVDAGWLVWTVLFALWGVAPFAAAVVVAVSVVRYWRRGVAAVAIGQAVLVVGTGLALWDVLTSESSTAVLGLLFAPLLQVAVVGVSMAAAVGLARVRRVQPAI